MAVAARKRALARDQACGTVNSDFLPPDCATSVPGEWSAVPQPALLGTSTGRGPSGHRMSRRLPSEQAGTAALECAAMSVSSPPCVGLPAVPSEPRSIQGPATAHRDHLRCPTRPLLWPAWGVGGHGADREKPCHLHGLCCGTGRCHLYESYT